MAVIVATGTNGFIGTNIVSKLLELTEEQVWGAKSDNKAFTKIIVSDIVNTCDRITYKRFQQNNILQFVSHTELEACLLQLSEKPVAIIHNGACSSTVETDPEIFATLNVNYSKMLWDIASKFNIPFLYASSAAVYGDGALGFSDKKEQCSIFKPLNLYAKSKHDFDLWVLNQQITPKNWFGLRYFNVYGQFEEHKKNQASMVYHGYNQIKNTGKIRLFKSTTPEFSDGETKRDFVYVKDIVNITVKILQLCCQNKLLAPNGFVNIGVGKAETWNNLALALFGAMSIKKNIEYFEMPSLLAAQYQNFTQAEHFGLKNIGVEHQFHDIFAGVQDYVMK